MHAYRTYSPTPVWKICPATAHQPQLMRKVCVSCASAGTSLMAPPTVEFCYSWPVWRPLQAVLQCLSVLCGALSQVLHVPHDGVGLSVCCVCQVQLAGLLFSCAKGGESQDTYVKVGGVLVDESPMVICVHCAHTTIPKKNTYKIQDIQRPAAPFQIAENGSDYDYREMYQILLQILCYNEEVLSQDLMAMQHK